MNTHHNLEVWKYSVEFVSTVYDITKDFPKEEIYGLSSQLRQSAIAIPSNIAEGSARKGNKEYKQFLYIALGNLAELETQLVIAHDLNYLENIAQYDSTITEIRSMLYTLIKSLKKKKE